MAQPSAMGRFLNADALVSTGQGVLGHNMFAYCLNNPISMTDNTGEFGLLTLCIIGEITGGALNYGSQVFENHLSGKSGSEMWTDANVGEVVAATFSGAVSAIPGASLLGDVVDAVGSNLIEDGVNSIFFGEEFDLNKVARKTFVDLCVPDVMMKKKFPNIFVISSQKPVLMA